MYNAEKEEQEILGFWEERKCFEKSVANRPEKRPYVFYDGPPFATGLPHYGHIVASLMKDAVPRYWTMRGFRVERHWGWDCHGLPVENIIEQELNLRSKRDIENYGVEKFNEACRKSVLLFAKEWKKTIRRMGRWVDMENDYKTMDKNYMESVWWVFRQLWDRGLIYQGHKAMHICPRCATPISNFEATQGYKDITDVSATVKFKIKNPKEKLGVDEAYVLAWTTTPWTLPGNVLLAVNPKVDYLLVRGEDGKNYVLAEGRLPMVFGDRPKEIARELIGQDLLDLEYEPLFPYFSATPGAFRIVGADFVTVADGTGVVHIAPAFGEDDFKIGEREKLPLVQHVTMEGKFTEAVRDFVGLDVKPKSDPAATDKKIVDWLEERGSLFSRENFTHSYPHCWRCDTPLLNYATKSWFIRVADFRQQLLKNNEKISWVPAHFKDGRFGLWLEGARDWAVSRNRYWGAPLPIWENAKGKMICFGSAAELSEAAGQTVDDLHKEVIDKIVINREGEEYRRVPEVLDCWFESGAMPYAQRHYPFENKESVEATFPAEFIAEGQDQTRGWFYTLHVLATLLTMPPRPAIPVKKSVPAFKNVIANGIVLAEDGKKMSKRLKNYPEPDLLMTKYGADAMRYYLLTSPVMEAENLNFSELGVRESYNKLVNTLWNVVEFYKMYGIRDSGKEIKPEKSKNILDRWILSRLNQLIGEVTKNMDGYRLPAASRPIGDFITDLSQWFLRRSRDRFKSENEIERQTATAVLRRILLVLSKVMAPFTPFIAEKIYQMLAVESPADFKESVHLEDWPEATKKVDEKLLTEMALARKIVELGLALRAGAGLKVRQPLAGLKFAGAKIDKELFAVIADELNVKKVEADDEFGSALVKEDGKLKVGLDAAMTPELKREGLSRELIRAVNQKRKEAGLTVSDRVVLVYFTESEDLKAALIEHAEELKKNVLADDLKFDSAAVDPLDIDGIALRITIEKK